MVKDGWSQSSTAVEKNTEQETTSATYLTNNNSKSYMYDSGSIQNSDTDINGLHAVNVWGAYETKEKFMEMHIC